MKKSKYRSVKTEYNGVIYHSKKEAAYAQVLNWMDKAGLINDLKRQVVFEWYEEHQANMQRIIFKRKYICDFTYFCLTDWKTVYVDVKGHRTAEYLKKKKIVEHLFNIKITEK